MTAFLEYFLPDELAAWIIAMALFCVTSTAVVWLLAMVLARVPVVVRGDGDLETRVQLGMAAALTAYGMFTTVFLLLLAIEYRARDISVLWMIPWCILNFVALLLAVSLAG